MTDRSYGHYCPVAKTLDLVGGRWTLLIVRELLVGPQRFTDLHAALEGIPRNLLSDRLRDLGREAAALFTAMRALFLEQVMDPEARERLHERLRQPLEK